MPKEEVKEILVVKELPTARMRVVSDGEKEYECITTEEAIKEILESIREIKKKF
jgi:hypothetical protein